jgi:hypothetical protein
MKKIILALVVIVVLVPAAALAAAPQDASTFCKANASSLIGTGKQFKSMGACVSYQNAQKAQNTTNASAACKAEMADTAFAGSHGGKTFAQFYGTNGTQASDKGKAGDNGNANGNALGKCVSAKANAKTASQQSGTVKAAKACKTDVALKAKIADKTYKNFGACVKAQSKTS